MATYRCPVCKKVLTKEEYESALGILQAKQAHLKHQADQLRRQTEELKQERASLKQKAKKAKASGIALGQRQEKERAERLMAGQRKTIATLEQRIRQLEKGTTPQTEGLEFEETLCERLQQEFPDDVLRHEGKGGDVLHFVMFTSKQAGVIVYECKQTTTIPETHIEQTARAKQTREADFGVLVTTGQKRAFSGLARSGGVIIVAPLGVVPLVSLLRAHLIEMLKANITREQRSQLAARLLSFVTSPQFKNPIEEVINRTGQLQSLILEEAKQHRRLWETRWDHYQTIRWDASQVQANVQLVLHGKEPKPLTRPTKQALQLPLPTE